MEKRTVMLEKNPFEVMITTAEKALNSGSVEEVRIPISPVQADHLVGEQTRTNSGTFESKLIE